MASPSPPAGCAALLKAFDESHTGVRGLVESGVSSVPDIFLHPDPDASAPLAPPGVTIPIVDLSLSFPAAAVAVAATARDWGFFHLVNYHHLHPIPLRRLPRARPQQAPGPRARQALRPRSGRRQRLLLLQRRPLPEASCLEGKVMVCHYYPVCPEPERTTGIVAHTDPGVLVVLTQDGVGGLQVRHHAGGEDDGRGRRVDVKPVPGALVVNFGDLLQMMSNDEYRSVEHRVVMNTREEATVSIAFFFKPGKRGVSDLYGPLPELVSEENPAKYRNFTIPEFLETFFSRELASKVLLEHFRV